MRKIKFRAWAMGEMAYEFSTPIGGIDVNAGLKQLQDMGFVLMQFTGLLDKNGKEIWEGDILVVPNDNYRPDDGSSPNEICSVEFKNGGFRTPEIAFSEVLDEHYCKNEVEVIGNIYSDPHLLDNENSELLES